MEKTTIYPRIMLPKKDCSGWDNGLHTIKVNTEFNPNDNSFSFRLEIPQFIYDAVKNTDEKYFTNPPKVDYHLGSHRQLPKFTKQIKAITLASALDQLNAICVDAISEHEKENADSDKLIAIMFTQGHSQQRDGFNHASMGFKTTSMFQFFPLFKIHQHEQSLNQYIYKSDKRVDGEFSSISYKKDAKWFYYTKSVIDKFQLIAWTQEREDFLQSIQNRLVDINKNLEGFLGNIDEDKIKLLMSNPIPLLEQHKS